MKSFALSLLLLIGTSAFGQTISSESIIQLSKLNSPSRVNAVLKPWGYQLTNTDLSDGIAVVSWENKEVHSGINIAFFHSNKVVAINWDFNDAQTFKNLKNELSDKGWAYVEDEVLDGCIDSHFQKEGENVRLTLSEGVSDSHGEAVYSLKLSPKQEDIAATEKEDSVVFTVVESMPTFNGDINAWLATNLHYPPVAAANHITGRVIVRFIVRKDGSISDATILRGVDSALDKEALRVINSMPKWNPGKHNGKAVNCYFQMPVVFTLN